MTDPVSFIGGISVPNGVSRSNASIPLVELTLHERSLRWRFRGLARRFMDAVLPVRDDCVALADLNAAFRLRGRLLRAGVGFELTDRSELYFWTWRHQEAVLTEISARGVVVDPTPRTALVARARRPSSG